MAKSEFLFTSESVTEGDPDKVADQISDAILDAIIAQDKFARVACETLVTTGLAMIAGEITTTAQLDFPVIVRDTIKEIGYNDSSMGFDWETCAVLVAIEEQSPDIAMGVNDTSDHEQGAGDQQGSGESFAHDCATTGNQRGHTGEEQQDHREKQTINQHFFPCKTNTLKFYSFVIRHSSIVIAAGGRLSPVQQP